MQITQSIKHAPKWAWYTAAGVGVGAAALKLYKGRASDTPTQAATDGTPAGSMTGTTPVLTASPTSVITPSVVGVSSGNDGGSLLDMMGLWTGAVQTTIDQLSNIYAPVAAIEADLLSGLPDAYQHNQFTPDQIIAMMQAGQAPAQVVQTPAAAGNSQTPAAQTPVQTTPPPPAPQAPPKATASGPQCGGDFPFVGPHGCYKVVCATGKGDHAKGRWHFYQNGQEEHVANTC